MACKVTVASDHSFIQEILSPLYFMKNSNCIDQVPNCSKSQHYLLLYTMYHLN